MENYDKILQSVKLFEDISPDDLTSMLGCLSTRTAKYSKGERLLVAGEKPENIGIVLDGQLQVVKEDVDGNRTLIASLSTADIFAEAFCCADIEESPVTVVASTDATVMLLKFSRILHTCPNSCTFHQKLIANMLKTVAQNNIYLQNRMQVVRSRSVRAKVLGYLEGFAQKRDQSFTIPLNREQMADYLCVERSALSHELMRMKKEGLLVYRKNEFTLL